jgi:hypothetical protein
MHTKNTKILTFIAVIVILIKKNFFLIIFMDFSADWLIDAS